MQSTNSVPTPAPKINSRLQSKLLIAAAVLLAVSLLSGVYFGVKFGQSKATYQSATDIYSALQFYNQDQSRYPSADQFYGQDLLVALNYIGQLPKPNDANGSCAAYPQFIYSQTAPQNFALQFCLTSAVGNLSAGPHLFTEKDLR